MATQAEKAALRKMVLSKLGTNEQQLSSAVAAKGSTVPTGAGGSNQPQDTTPGKDGAVEKLLEQSGIVSSAASGIEEAISSSQAGVREAAQLGQQRIESQYQRESGYLLDEAGYALTQADESRVGYATQLGAYRRLTGSIDKQLADLAQRKEELILQNNANAASKIADLELQTLQYRLQAEQQVFNNLLGITGVEQQAKQITMQEEAQSFQEQIATSSIALQYGIQPQATGETFDDFIGRASLKADKKQQLELQQMQLQMDNLKAQTASIQQARGDKARMAAQIKGMTQEEINILYQRGILTAQELSDAGVSLASVAASEKDFIKTQALLEIPKIGGTKEDAFDNLRANSNFKTLSDVEIQEMVDAYYRKQAISGGELDEFNIYDVMEGGSELIIGGTSSILRFFGLPTPSYSEIAKKIEG